MTDIDTLQAGRELDALVAKALGWTDFTESHVTGEPIALKPGGSRPPDGSTRRHSLIPKFSTDIAAAYEMEAHLPERLQGQFGGELSWIVQADNGGSVTCWLLAHATPSQRCRAALKAVTNDRP